MDQALPLHYADHHLAGRGAAAEVGAPVVAAADPRKRTLAAKYLFFLALVLTGYAIGGRGFAYLGLSPLFIGEMALAGGLLVMALTPGSLAVFARPRIQLLGVFMIWGLIQTVPYIDDYGMLAMRDAVIWGYGFFAIIVASLLIAEPSRLPRLFWQYRTFIPLFLIAIPLVLTLRHLIPGIMPDMPGTTVSIFTPRRGNTMVHMAAVCGFFIVGFAPRRTLALIAVSIPWMMLMFANRAGLVSFGGAVVTATVLSRVNRKSSRMWMSLLTVVIFGGVIGMNISWQGGKAIDIDKFLAKIETIVGSGGEAKAQESKEWRLAWWGKIVNYTFNGRHFWTGKGFGVNLASDDGFQVSKDEELRSPHSIHMNVLARTGVPGLAMWLILQGLWGVGIFRSFLHCRKRQDAMWSGVFLALLTYWMAHMANSGFDVDLEGPPGGIWFWSVFGVGIAAMEIYRRNPDVFALDPDWSNPRRMAGAWWGSARQLRGFAVMQNWHRPSISDRIATATTQRVPPQAQQQHSPSQHGGQG